MRVASIISLIAVGLLSSVAVSLPIPSEHTSQYRASKTPVYQQNTEISIDEIELISSSVKNVAVPATADTVALSYIRNMTKHAWDSYSKYAWGYDYLRPVSKSGMNHHASSMSFTIVDALDTLKIMGLEAEFDAGRNYVASIDESKFHEDVDVSFFETTIRVIGGLISAYDLSDDKMFIEKAAALADRLIPAFNTETGLPNNIVNLKTGKNYLLESSTHLVFYQEEIQKHIFEDVQAVKRYGNIAEIASNILELTRLSQITKNDKYEKVARRALDALQNLVGPKLPVPGLFPVWISTEDGTLRDEEDPEYSVGACADSFFEYLLKNWLMSGKTDTQCGEMFDEAIYAIKKHLLKINHEGLYYLPSGRLNELNFEMQHLTCFTGGMIALHVISGKSESVEEDTNIAAGITDTCYKMYHRQTLGLSPETVDLRSKSLHSNHPQYNQRPEVIESIFYMWRITHDPKYREWALNIAQSIEHATRLEGGYSGITNVYEDYDLHYNDLQDSFYIAETLKYLYLVFEADDFLNLDEWVLNTEAHLFKSRVLTYTESERDHDHAFEALSTLLQTMTTNHENHLQGLDGSSSEDASHNEEL